MDHFIPLSNGGGNIIIIIILLQDADINISLSFVTNNARVNSFKDGNVKHKLLTDMWI